MAPPGLLCIYSVCALPVCAHVRMQERRGPVSAGPVCAPSVRKSGRAPSASQASGRSEFLILHLPPGQGQPGWVWGRMGVPDPLGMGSGFTLASTPATPKPSKCLFDTSCQGVLRTPSTPQNSPLPSSPLCLSTLPNKHLLLGKEEEIVPYPQLSSRPGFSGDGASGVLGTHPTALALNEK